MVGTYLSSGQCSLLRGGIMLGQSSEGGRDLGTLGWLMKERNFGKVQGIFGGSWEHCVWWVSCCVGALSAAPSPPRVSPGPCLVPGPSRRGRKDRMEQGCSLSCLEEPGWAVGMPGSFGIFSSIFRRKGWHLLPAPSRLPGRGPGSPARPAPSSPIHQRPPRGCT